MYICCTVEINSTTTTTDVHLSLAVVFVFTSEMESDTAARHIARYGSFNEQARIVSNVFMYSRLLDTTPNVEQLSEVKLCDDKSVVTME